MKKEWIVGVSGICLAAAVSWADHPLVVPGNDSFPDVNFEAVGDTVYAFGGTDVDARERTNGKIFNMAYWRCFSSKDLINWTYESEVHPEQTYIGPSDQCWAGHAVPKDGKWYWYLSNWNKNTAVVVADSAKGPWVDPLGKPLLYESMTPTKEYDKCVFIDDDGQAYIVFGINRQGGYHLAELNDDMISLKTQPVLLPNDLVTSGDAPFLHKVNGKYYLSSRKDYAVSDSIYGPYTQIGSHEAGGHAGYFSFNNQTYVNYTARKPGLNASYRFVALAYVHYRADGSMVTKEPKPDAYGVGRYDAQWGTIEAEWFFAMPGGPKKTELGQSGFEISNIQNGDYLRFPNINNCANNPTVALTYSCGNATGGTVSVYEGGEAGKKIGEAHFGSTGSWAKYETLSIPVSVNGPTVSLTFVFNGTSGKELIRVDSFGITAK